MRLAGAGGVEADHEVARDPWVTQLVDDLVRRAQPVTAPGDVQRSAAALHQPDASGQLWLAGHGEWRNAGGADDEAPGRGVHQRVVVRIGKAGAARRASA